MISQLTTTAHVITSDQEAIDIAIEQSRQLLKGASERDRLRANPEKELDALSASGLLAITVPRKYGGAGVSGVTLTRVYQLLSAGDSAISQLPQSHFVFLDAIREDGSEEQKRFFFGEVLKGGRLGNAQAEIGSESALDLKTRLTRKPDGKWELNGTKHYCTGAVFAHWIPVAALDDEERLVLVYVPRHAPGVKADFDWNAMGQRTTFSGTTVLNRVEVTDEQIVPHWKLFERPSLFHSFAQLLHGAIDVGIAQNALEEGTALIRSRKRARLGAPAIAPTQDPLLILRLGELHAQFHAAEALLQRAAQVYDRVQGKITAEGEAEFSVAVSEAKAFAEAVSITVSSDLFSLLGSSAADEKYNFNRHWRNARTHTVHDSHQWRYYSAGNYHLNGVFPAKPVRRLTSNNQG